METLSFEVPILGCFYTMYIDLLKFNLQDDSFYFYSHMKNEPAITVMYCTRRTHKEIIHFLEDTPYSPLMLNQINKYKYEISFEKNYQNIEFIVHMLYSLFPQQEISMEMVLYNDHYFFGKCVYHLLDLYEMGYMSIVDVVIAHPFYTKHQTRIFTGLILVARNAYQKYNDFVELSFFKNVKNDFLRLSLDMIIQDRPHMVNKLDRIIKEMILSIPLKEEKSLRKQLWTNWKHNHDMEIKLNDLQLPLNKWKPSLFLKSISQILDMFPNYHVSPQFNLEISFSKISSSS